MADSRGSIDQATGGGMESHTYYLLAADLLLVTHALFVAFVIFGLLFVLVGRFLGWSWVRNLWFRIAHLAAISVVVLQSWFGMICPLTTWEMALRDKAGDAVYDGTFVSHWISSILYYNVPAWVFVVGYTLFGLLVVIAWIWVRPYTPAKIRRSLQHEDRIP